MRLCRKCGVEKELDCFYKHAQMPDGYLNFCKECVKKRIHNKYVEDLGLSRKKEKLRYERRKKDPAFLKLRQDYDRQYKSNSGHRISCTILRKLYKKRPDICELCGIHSSDLSWTMHAHHPDYLQPEKVKWLCPACHKKIHLEKR